MIEVVKGIREMKKIFSVLLVLFLTFSTWSSVLVKADSPSKGTLTIHKYEQEKDGAQGLEGDGSANQEVPKDAKPLKGVTFEVKRVASFEKISNDGKIVKEDVKPVMGATPTQVVTDDNGQAVLNLPLGRYEVKEVAGPPHVNLNPNTYTVDIPLTNKEGKVLNYDVHMYPKNEVKRGAVDLIKTGVNEKALAGAVFSLFKKDGTEVKKELVTDANGHIRVQGLVYGEYYFQETKAPKGYVIDPTKREFFVKNSGTINEDGTITSGTVVKLEVKNYEEPIIDKKINGKLEALPINPLTNYNYDIKTLIPEDIKEYKKYVVTDTLDNRLVIQGKPIVKIDGAEVNASIVEVAIEGQKVTATVKDFTKLDGKNEFHLQIKSQVKEGVPSGSEILNTAKIDFTNKNDVIGEKESKPVVVVPTTGIIELTKIDGANKNKLKGAEFELKDKNGKIVVVAGKEVTGVSDENGVIKWSNIPYGDYQIFETKAPTYTKEDGTKASYQLLKDPIDVKISENNQTVKLTIENNKSGWVLPVTGGIGTTLFTVIGLTLMVTAAFVFFRKKFANN
ncbi:LPXTG-domain-containing protein cell wall anchor domain [Bacillus cereus BAG1X2-3]|nr:LPXTG-domain-containing protein cell wall anchor domain [Bacillus cereus BAG1X1-1]EOO49187.1 LPXTG-domain-containing protein cell wall anchor domain [Bacillus cereus BAG1X2-1]EOO52622.1 LPXTG-domain-containing protein cell wall anchor domain [Bacillus cereus BAG1X2-2]EOO59452.1 LPXTG-domain-containing protein cell wall anchor domain [Bacillus cereus BAG1X2-3]EOP05732.1 LPXTG-domain-containing protein cell wall anchor domain [Bacillus cereus BAG2O-1]